MRTTNWETATSRVAQGRTLLVERYAILRMTALTAILALAAALRLTNLAALGYVNHYYSAAVASMLQSWHNFFFVAAEPGGSVSVDKPPVGLWLQTISAHFFGVSAFGVLLPEIVAGLLSIMVVYHLVRRSYGTIAGLVAALALAITPVVVATDRNNTIDSTLIFTLLLAAWAFIVATERGRLRYLLLGVLLVGISFNIKMLEAFLPLPAFYALYFFGSPERLGRKLGNLTLASVVLLVVSLSWATIVDLTPADQRPYVGSSGDNSEMSLITGYNGMERLLGMGGRGGLLGGLLANTPFGGGSGQQAPGFGAGFQRPGFGGNGFFGQSGTGPNRISGRMGQSPKNGSSGVSDLLNAPVALIKGIPNLLGGMVTLFNQLGAFPTRQGRGFGGFGGFGGVDGTGQPGALRLFTAPLSNEASWLLPFALFAAVLLLFRARPRWPLSQKHQTMLLWGGWLLTDMAFFSVAGFFHPYYLSTLGAPIAALVGIGVAEIWKLRDRHLWVATALLIVAVVVTLKLQVGTATAFVNATPWIPLVIGLAIAGAALLAVSAVLRKNRLAAAGFACVIAAMLITPGIWSELTTLHPSDNQSLPSAYDGRSSGPPNDGKLQVNQSLLQYLQANTQGTEYLMAVPSSMQGSDYVLATGRPVLYMGGFMGLDQVVTTQQLDQLVADGKLRYIYWNSAGFGRGFRSQSDISQWVETNGIPVNGFDTLTRNSGAPGGTSAGMPAGGTARFMGGGEMQITLYQLLPRGGM